MCYSLLERFSRRLNHWTVRQKPRTVFPHDRYRNSGSSWIPCVTIRSFRKLFRNPNSDIHKLAWALQSEKLDRLDNRTVLPESSPSQRCKHFRELANSHQKPLKNRMDQYSQVKRLCQSTSRFSVIFSNRELRRHASVVQRQIGHTIGLSPLLPGSDYPLERDEVHLRPASTDFGLRRYSPSAHSL